MKFFTKKVFFKYLILFLLFVLLFLFSISFGTEKIPLRKIFDFSNYSKLTLILVRDIRLSRTVLAVIVGALLAGSGAVFQGFFRNSLADPAIMGVSSGAAFGAVSATIAIASLGVAVTNANGFLSTSAIVPFAAFFGAILPVIISYIVAGKTKSNEKGVSLLLSGTAISAFFSAINSIILLAKYKELHKMYVWTLGSLNGKGWNEVVFILPFAIVSVILFFYCAPMLDVLTCGENSAKSMGLDINKKRIFIIGAATIGTATAVCVGGTIGFVGLIAPHMARLLFGAKHKKLIFTSMILGALLLVFSDIIARTIAAPMELPVGIVTSLLGTPFFLYIMISKGMKL